jgi:hypothetical protein
MQVVRSVPMKYQTKKQFTLVSPKWK